MIMGLFCPGWPLLNDACLLPGAAAAFVAVKLGDKMESPTLLTEALGDSILEYGCDLREEQLQS